MFQNSGEVIMYFDLFLFSLTIYSCFNQKSAFLLGLPYNFLHNTKRVIKLLDTTYIWTYHRIHRAVV